MAECPDLDSESGNRTDKWQITDRGKSYIQADAILETPQPVLLTLQKKLPDRKIPDDNNSDFKFKSTETPTVADKCHHENTPQTELCMSPGSVAESSTVKPCLRK